VIDDTMVSTHSSRRIRGSCTKWLVAFHKIICLQSCSQFCEDKAAAVLIAKRRECENVLQEGADVEKGKGDLIAKEDQEIGQIGYKVYW
jgi:hypothetical protein